MGLESKALSRTSQYCSFLIAGRLYGIDVRKVQEVVKPMPMTRVHLADGFVNGLINLRGQVATAIGLRELFGLRDHAPADLMNVVCRCDGHLISFLVDDIGEVIEVLNEDYEPTPSTIPLEIRKYMSGVYKVKDSLMSVIDIDLLFKDVSI